MVVLGVEAPAQVTLPDDRWGQKEAVAIKVVRVTRYDVGLVS